MKETKRLHKKTNKVKIYPNANYIVDEIIREIIRMSKLRIHYRTINNYKSNNITRTGDFYRLIGMYEYLSNKRERDILIKKLKELKLRESNNPASTREQKILIVKGIDYSISVIKGEL
ncbi:MAG: hypothetical protein ACYCS1_05390 [Gammaproteobacteria bacterium]